ncbi:MAG: hypothetical protein AAB439_01480 [Patescibacteria group bacterium]
MPKDKKRYVPLFLLSGFWIAWFLFDSFFGHLASVPIAGFLYILPVAFLLLGIIILSVFTFMRTAEIFSKDGSSREATIYIIASALTIFVFIFGMLVPDLFIGLRELYS